MDGEVINQHRTGDVTLLSPTSDGTRWVRNPKLVSGLEIDGKPVRAVDGERDLGLRSVDVNFDGRLELVVGNEKQNAVFGWSEAKQGWVKHSDSTFTVSRYLPFANAAATSLSWQKHFSVD